MAAGCFADQKSIVKGSKSYTSRIAVGHCRSVLRIPGMHVAGWRRGYGTDCGLGGLLGGRVREAGGLAYY